MIDTNTKATVRERLTFISFSKFSFRTIRPFNKQQQKQRRSTHIMDEDKEIMMDTSDSSSPVGPNTTCQRQDSSRGRKAVGFRGRASIEEVRRISRISNRSLEEVIAYWGTSEDHKLRKQELRAAAHDMQVTRRMSDNMSFTTLGLADKVGEGKAIKKAHRAKSREAVLDEQDLQYHEGIVDDELIADVYTITTAGAQKDAHHKARALHEEVEKF